MSTIDKKLVNSKKYREEFVSAFLKRSIPFQVRTIRKKRKLMQEQLAEAAGIKQGVISRAEDPDYGNLTFNTVLRIAAGFDLAFIGRFVTFGEFTRWVDGMSEKSFDKEHLPNFSEELALKASAEVEVRGGCSVEAKKEPQRADHLVAGSNGPTSAHEVALGRKAEQFKDNVVSIEDYFRPPVSRTGTLLVGTGQCQSEEARR